MKYNQVSDVRNTSKGITPNKAIKRTGSGAVSSKKPMKKIGSKKGY